MISLIMADPGAVPQITASLSSSSEEWQHYVFSHPSATVYHLPAWSRILEKSFGYEPFHLIARNAGGVVCGVLPLLLVKSALTGRRLVSLPFSYRCGPLADSPEVLQALMEEACQLQKQTNSLYLELKGLLLPPHVTADKSENGWEKTDQFSTYILDLLTPGEVWKKLDPRVRQHINRARRDGVTIRKGSSVEDFRIFYRLNLKVKKRIGVPGHPEDFLLNIGRDMSDICTLYLAELKNRVIGGHMVLKFNGVMLSAFAASNDRYRKNQPNSLLYWTAIEDACREGTRCFDFGRTSPAEPGGTTFKKHWGTEEKRLTYCYYPHLPHSLALEGTGWKYRLATGLWRKMPLAFAHTAGKQIFRHLG